MRDATWDQLVTKVDRTLDFCRSLDLRAEVEASRFLRHRERVAILAERLMKDGNEGAMEAYNSDRLSSIVALTEIAELGNIGSFLRACDPAGLQSKLRAILGGPDLPSDEDENSNYARNILFELNLGAKLWEGGVSPKLGDRPDLTCELQGKKLLVECKRALTKRGAQQRLRKAWKDLSALVGHERPGTRGIVALSLSKLINPGDAIFYFADEASARSGLGEILSEKADLLRESWVRSGTKVIGAMFHVITPAFLEDTKILALQQRTHGVALATIGTLDEQVFRELVGCLSKNWH
jgi:hypothetical protein